ncbi:MAG: PAS domain S-box protein [Methanoregula sp.]
MPQIVSERYILTRTIPWWQVIAVLILVAGAGLTCWTAQQQDTTLRTDLLIKTRIAELGIITSQLSDLSGSPSDLTASEYQALKIQLERIQSNTPKVRFAYLMGQRSDGTIFIYADSESPESKDYSPPGQDYTEASVLIHQVFATGTGMTQGQETDRWGTWVSAFVPITNPGTGKVIAVMGLDVDAADWNLLIFRASLPILIVTLLILLLVLVFAHSQNRLSAEKRRIAESEELLREKEAFQRVLLDNLTSGVVIVDVKTHTIERVNPAATALFGMSPEGIIGKNCHLYLCPGADTACPITDLHSDVDNAERTLLRADGTTIPILKSVKKITIGGEEKLLENFIDITRRKEAEAALERKSATLSILNAIISTANRADDLGQLLSGILAKSMLLLDFDAGGIYLVDRATRTATIVHAANIPPELLHEIQTVPIDIPPYDTLYVKNEPVIAGNYDQLAPDRSKKFGFLSIASIPLVSRGVAIGSLNIASTTRQVISTEERDTLISIGRELGSTIERMAVEDEVRTTKKNLETLFDSIDEMVFVLDLHGHILSVNKTVTKRLLYTPEELIGTDVLLLHAPEQREEALRIIRKMIAGTADTCPAPVVAKDGTRIDVETKVTHGWWNNQDVLIGVTRDVTERKRAEEKLRHISDRLVLATRAGGVGIWDYDVVNNTLTWDDQMFALYGISPDQFGGAYESWQQGLHPDDRARGDVEIQQALRKEKEFDTEFRVVWADGSIHTLRALALVQRDATGKPLRMIGTNWDITERKRVEDAVIEANKKLNILNSVTRHDVLNQITGLIMLLQIVEESSTDPEIIGFVRKAEGATERITRQIEFTREYQDIGVELPHWQNVTDLIRTARTQLTECPFELRVELDGIEIYADPLLVKVFYNLLENAVRHGEHVSMVRFFYQESGDALVLVYEDNGAGIDPDSRKHLFKRGFGKHTGFGLYLIREILSITGITIAETGTPGMGARFELVVPKGMYRFTEPAKQFLHDGEY